MKGCIYSILFFGLLFFGFFTFIFMGTHFLSPEYWIQNKIDKKCELIEKSNIHDDKYIQYSFKETLKVNMRISLHENGVIELIHRKKEKDCICKYDSDGKYYKRIVDRFTKSYNNSKSTYSDNTLGMSSCDITLGDGKRKQLSISFSDRRTSLFFDSFTQQFYDIANELLK